MYGFYGGGRSLLVLIKKEIYALKRWFRRRYLIWFKPKYVLEQIKLRKGICGKHGCCDLTILDRMAHHGCLNTKDRTSCMRWQNFNFECKVYPIDEEDKIPETFSYCNFYWDHLEQGNQRIS